MVHDQKLPYTLLSFSSVFCNRNCLQGKLLPPNHTQQNANQSRMSSLQTSFPWGFKKAVISKPTKNKRKIQEDIDTLGDAKSRTKFHPNNSNSTSRKHRTHAIMGTKLPLNTLIETLDHESLQKLVKSLVEQRPDVQEALYNAAPTVTVQVCIDKLTDKVENIKCNLPYKVDTECDYTYLRVKALVHEFFQALSDYMLNFLPPQEYDVSKSIEFLNGFLLKVLLKMPMFSHMEFKYYYKLTLDKLNTVYVNLIADFIQQKPTNILLLKDSDLAEKLLEINKHYEDYFEQVSQLLSQDEGSDIPERLQGLSNLLNFSSENNPLNGGVVSSVKGSW